MAAVAGVAALAIVSWTLTTGASYSLVSHFVHMRPVTAVTTARPEVGVLVDAPASEIPTIANYLSERGIRASFTLSQAADPQEPIVVAYGDQAVPRLPTGGLVRWLGARDQLHDLMAELGYGHHFLYASSGPSVGQWWMAHGAGGRLVAGAVRLQDSDDSVGHLRPGEVVELDCTSAKQVTMLVGKLDRGLVDLPPARRARRSAHSRLRLDGLATSRGDSTVPDCSRPAAHARAAGRALIAAGQAKAIAVGSVPRPAWAVSVTAFVVVSMIASDPDTLHATHM